MKTRKEIADRFFSLFCDMPQKDLAKRFGVQQSIVSEWKTGKRSIPWQILMNFAQEEEIDLDWLILGRARNKIPQPISVEEMTESLANLPKLKTPDFQIFPPVRGPIPFSFEARGVPVVGEAAADETQGRHAGFFPPDANAIYDELTMPETTAAVRIIGDSMSPVLLHGQYALLGPEHSGPYDLPKNYDIVVADVTVRDEDQEGVDRQWEGVYCKRIVDAGDVWVFLSINHTGTPFSVAKANCRTWPVIGVWFAGKGVSPED